MVDQGDGGTEGAGSWFDRQEAVDVLRQAFEHTPLHRLLGLRFVGIGQGVSVVEMPVRSEAFNPVGNLHGGALATLIDVAAGSAAATAGTFVPGENTLVTADLHVRYLGRPKTDTVRAEAGVMRSGRQLVVVEVRVLDGLDNVIAFADFSSMVVPLREPLEGAAPADRRSPDL
ncbi:MAG: PaaI family thioesterase [Acidimicrobiia bacterium]|nr:PaaI family thioesterase [Acidimicrobiia bacterium]